MNARYYDPQLGQFISPDSLVPDATNVMDFNRYAYARGNPMKYNDPSGHCIAQGQNGWNSTENIQCYADAYNIANLGGLEYIQKYFGGGYKSVDQWLKAALSDPNLDGNFLHPHAGPLYQNWCSSAGVIGQAGCSGGRVQSNDNTIVEDPLTIAVRAYCQNHDCVGLGLDGTSVVAGGFGVLASAVCGPIAAVECGAGVASMISNGASIAGAARTWRTFRDKPTVASGIDAQMSTATTLAGGLAKNPKVALTASIVQLIYDNGGNKVIAWIFNDLESHATVSDGGGGGSGGFK